MWVAYVNEQISDASHYKRITAIGVLPFRLIFTFSFRVTVCLGLGIGLESGLGELGLGEMGLGETGQNPAIRFQLSTHVGVTYADKHSGNIEQTQRECYNVDT